jgi:hypothetical protein
MSVTLRTRAVKRFVGDVAQPLDQTCPIKRLRFQPGNVQAHKARCDVIGHLTEPDLLYKPGDFFLGVSDGTGSQH